MAEKGFLVAFSEKGLACRFSFSLNAVFLEKALICLSCVFFMVKVFARTGFARLLALLFVFLLFSASAFAFWPSFAWNDYFRGSGLAVQEKAPAVSFSDLEKKFGAETIAFVKKLNNRLGGKFSAETLKGLALIIKNFPEGNGKAVLDALTDKAFGPVWDAGDLEEMAEIKDGQLTRFFFKKSLFTKTSTVFLDAIAMPYYKDFFIETAALNSRLSRPKTLYSKIISESKKFRGVYSDATLVIVLKKGSSIAKKETEKTIREAFENSKNLDIQNISRIAIYDAKKQKTITVYGRQDWLNRKP